jgi:hypothetical protein
VWWGCALGCRQRFKTADVLDDRRKRPTCACSIIVHNSSGITNTCYYSTVHRSFPAYKSESHTSNKGHTIKDRKSAQAIQIDCNDCPPRMDGLASRPLSLATNRNRPLPTLLKPSYTGSPSSPRATSSPYMTMPLPAHTHLLLATSPPSVSTHSLNLNALSPDTLQPPPIQPSPSAQHATDLNNLAAATTRLHQAMPITSLDHILYTLYPPRVHPNTFTIEPCQCMQTTI